MAALEVVFVTGIVLIMAPTILALMLLTLKRFFGMLGNSVGMPYI
jgi:hypothetical protein